jgi:PAS domain S-box-containing protein
MAEARHAAELRFRVVFDNAAVAIGVVDTTGVFLDGGPALAAMLGQTAAALQGRSVFDFVHPADRDEIRARVYGELVTVGAGTIRLDLRYQRTDYSYGWTSWAVTLAPEAPGRAAYLLGVGEDTPVEGTITSCNHDYRTRLPTISTPTSRAPRACTTTCSAVLQLRGRSSCHRPNESDPAGDRADARANRAFLHRAVTDLLDACIDQAASWHCHT